METELETLDSAGGLEAQEDYPAASSEGAQDGSSAADDGSSQDSDEVAALRAELAESRQAIEDAKTQIGVLQSTKDKEVRAAQAQYQSLVQRLGAQRSREERQALLERAKRAQNDPDEAEALVNDLLSRLQRTEADEEWQQRLLDTDQQARQQAYVAVYNDEKLGLTAEERRLAEERAMAEPEGLSIQGFARHAAAIKEEKARSPMDTLAAELKSLREEVAALKGDKTSAALKSAGGPERPLATNSGGRASYHTLEEAEAAHVRGEVTNAQMREYRRTLQYTG